MPVYDPARLKALVVESGLSYEAVHARGGPDKKNLYSILAGRTTPQADTLAAILDAIGRRWGDLDPAHGKAHGKPSRSTEE